MNNYLLKLFLTFVLATIGLALAFFVSAFVFKYFVVNRLYSTIFYSWILWISNNIIFFMISILLLMYATILVVYMRKLTRYIDEIILVASTIHNSDTTIEMSPELDELSNQFIQIKREITTNRLLAHEADKRKNDLLVYLAHDLKTPLTSIIGYLTFLNDEKDLAPDIHQKYLGITKEKALRLEDLLNEFFEIARFNLTSVEMEFKEIQLDLLVEQLAYEFKPLYHKKNMQCYTNLRANTYIMGDANKLSRAIDNLLLNVYHYSYENSDVYINLEQLDNFVCLTLINQGKTIDPQKIDLLFEQFYRLDNARGSEQGGSGLGLSITKEIISAHHGTITASSCDEKIVFSIQIPTIS